MTKLQVEIIGDEIRITCGAHGVDVRGMEALEPASQMLIEILAGVSRADIAIAVADALAAVDG
jgi:hypothetical protein